MGKATTYTSDEDDGDYFTDDLESGAHAEPEARKREPKVPNRYAARQLLDSRKEDLWLKQQLKDWDDELESAAD